MAIKKDISHVFCFALVERLDGSAITTGAVTSYVTLDGGTQAATSNSAVHEGNGQWSLTLTAAELNADDVGLLITHATAVPVHFDIHTETELAADLSTVLAAIVADTGELQTDWADGGRLDLLLDGVAGGQVNITTKNTTIESE